MAGCKEEGTTEPSVTESQSMPNGTTDASGCWKPSLISSVITAVVLCIVAFLVFVIKKYCKPKSSGKRNKAELKSLKD